MKGIVLPETAQAKVNEGKVRAVGPGRIGPDGKRIFSSFFLLPPLFSASLYCYLVCLPLSFSSFPLSTSSLSTSCRIFLSHP